MPRQTIGMNGYTLKGNNSVCHFHFVALLDERSAHELSLVGTMLFI